MNCEQYDQDLIDAAAGAATSAGLEGHLEGCLSCRRRLEEHRRALEGFDRDLRARLRVEPSPSLSGRVASRLDEQEVAGQWSPRRLLAVAAGVGVAVLAGWLGHTPSTLVPTGPREAAIATTPKPLRRGPAAREVSPSVDSAREATALSGPSLVRRVPKAPLPAPTRARESEPEVLVPPGQEEALRWFVASLRSGAAPVPPLLVTGASVEGLIVPAPLIEIPLLEAQPLADSVDFQERSHS